MPNPVDPDSTPSSSPGELPFIDADQLEQHQGTAAAAEADIDNLDPDSRAIAAIARLLGERSKASPERIDEFAIQLYNQLCAKIRNRTASAAEIERAARICEESVEELLERLDSSSTG